MEIGVVPGGVMKYLVRSVLTKMRGHKNIDNDGGDGEGFDLVARRKMGLKEERADHIA